MKRIIRTAARPSINRLFILEMRGRVKWNPCNAVAFDSWRRAMQEKREYEAANPDDTFRVVRYFSLNSRVDSSRLATQRDR